MNCYRQLNGLTELV